MTVGEVPRQEPNRSPRVAVVAYTEYPWDPRVRRGAEMLAEDGYAVDAITLRPTSGPSPTKLGGVNLWEVPLVRQRGGRARYLYQYAMFLLLSTTLLVRLQLRHRFRLVHVHSLPDFQVFCALPLRLAGVPVVLDLHEAMPEIVEARFHLPSTAVLPRIAALLEALSCRFASHVVAANDGIRGAVVARGLPGDRITSVYTASDVPAVPPSLEELRHDLHVPDGRLIVHAGGLNPERDLGTLLQAIARLREGKDIQLVLAGDGEPAYIRSLGQLAADLGLDERVHFLGRLAQTQAQGLVSLSEIGVVTLQSNPLTQLAWPTRILDFVALGKPLVVPRLRFLSSVLGDAAQYYTPGDPTSLATALEATLADRGTSNVTAGKAQQLCRRFQPGRTREVLHAIYQNLEESHA